ncbi:hypothetical protein P4C99_04720 [Pontiellaceae bacterium B1224]|nr:hypothetical protein [Pontiellaceae bacterium B1224]
MPRANQKRIIRLLGVGFDSEDGHVRITKGDRYDVLMGSDESHEYIQKLIARIEEEMKARGVTLDDFSPEEFSDFVQSVL